MKTNLPLTGGESASSTAAPKGRKPATASNRKRKAEEAAAAKADKRSKKKNDKNVVIEQIVDDETDSEGTYSSTGSEEDSSSRTRSRGASVHEAQLSSDEEEEEEEVEESLSVRPRKRREARARKGKGAKDEQWQLKSNPGGGPEEVDLLYGFGHHRARKIWENATCEPVLKRQTRQQILDKFSHASLPEDDRAWWARVEGTGLHFLHDATIRRPSMALLTAFVERWSPETNTFHMPWGEMTITMHDVTHILGISCSGGPVAKADPEPDVAGIRARLETCRKGTTYSLDGLRRSFESPSDMTDDERASTYIMFLLGSTLFVDKTQDKMPSDYLSLCVDIDRVGALSWGTAALVYLYRELGKASRYGCKQIGGCLSLLEAWMYEHFPVFRREIDPLWTEGQPRALRWVRTDTAGRDMPHLLKFRYTLDTMTVDRVCWTPYGTTPEALLPVSYFRGVIRFQDITEAYLPDRVTRQFGIQQKILRDPISCGQNCSLIAGQKGYKKSYGARDDVWEDWLEDGLGGFDPVRRWGPSVSASDPVTSTYMQWFLARTHVRITNPNHDALVNVPPPPRVVEARGILLSLLTDDSLSADVKDKIRRAIDLYGDAS